MNKQTNIFKMLLLGGLCGICGLLLAIVNSITAPIIEEASLANELESLEKMFPGASFKEVDYTDDTGLVLGVYEAEGQGMVYKLAGKGYDSEGFTFMVAYDNDGKVAGYTALEEHETEGIGKRAFQDEYVETIKGLTSSDAAPILSGATLTSTAIKDGMDAARALFNDAKGIAYDPNAPADEPEPAVDEAKPLGEEDLSAYGATCEETSNDGTTAVYACVAKGFKPDNAADVTVDVASNTVTSFVVTNDADNNDEVGDNAFKQDHLDSYAGVALDQTVDNLTGATETTKAFKAMMQAALFAASGQEAPVVEVATITSEDLSANGATCEKKSEDGTLVTFGCKAKGFYPDNEADVTIDTATNTVTEFVVTADKDNNDEVGDNAFKQENLDRYVGVTGESSIEGVSGATETSKAFRAMIQAALNAVQE